MSEITLKAALARYMDPQAFREGVPASVKFTCKAAGRTLHDKLKRRREIAMKRAEAAIRFFSRPENLEWLERRNTAVARDRVASLAANVSNLQEQIGGVR